MKVQKFELELRPTIKEKLVALRLQSYSQIVERACLIEKELLDSQSYIGQRNQVRRKREYEFIFIIFREKSKEHFSVQ